ncbi:RipA family octameric membrane protein [Actinoplanes sp. CA-030573]|uniref:RipA family octameric membrane protein n=1 Tax=Actinoplanes sp. CA-030573 TaxID=3239898 RepID=UPI003D8C978B
MDGDQRTRTVLTMGESQSDARDEAQRAESLDWWKHYDTLRQDKNKTFLATNSFLVAAVGFSLKNGRTGTTSDFVLLLLVAIVGFLASVLWFVLLSRNTLYIEFHRDRVATAERRLNEGPGLDAQWEDFKKTKKPSPWENLSSNNVDRLLSLVIVAFWLAVGVVSITLLA